MGVPRGQAQGRHVVNRNSLSKRPLAAHLSQCAALTWKSGLWQHSPLLGACSTGSFVPIPVIPTSVNQRRRRPIAGLVGSHI